MINKQYMGGHRYGKALHLVRRPRLGRARFGEPIVEFSYPWPQGVKHLYVVSTSQRSFQEGLSYGV